MHTDEPRVQVQPRVVEVRWPEGSLTALPHLWLRHNCGCDSCRCAQTGEKQFLVSDVPPDLAPRNAYLEGDRLRVQWPDGHLSEYAGAEVRALTRQVAPGWRGWRNELRPLRTDFRRFLDEPAAAIDTLEEFLATGVCVLTGAPTGPGTLEELSPRLGPLREVLFARIHDVHVDPSGYNVAHTAMALPPHNDFASYSWPPSVQALHMLANQTPGGDSIVVDGWMVLEWLRSDCPELFAALCNMPVPFREFDENNETYAVAPLVRCDVDGNLAAFRFSNQLMQALNPTRPGVGEFYRAYHELSRRLCDPAVQSRFRLASGQILIVASHRVLHARTAFLPTGRRHLQDAYFEHDNVRNHLTVLRRRAAAADE